MDSVLITFSRALKLRLNLCNHKQDDKKMGLGIIWGLSTYCFVVFCHCCECVVAMLREDRLDFKRSNFEHIYAVCVCTENCKIIMLNRIEKRRMLTVCENILQPFGDKFFMFILANN